MKNLYQILGVLDTAEDIVIRAAYKALAQRYHPDKWQGNAEEATVRMREINDAYRILSDPIEKAKYDKTLDKKEYQEEPDIEENIDASLEDAWKVGLVFFPKLDELYLHLRKTNYALGNTFKLIVIENQAFDKGLEIAEKMEKEFLIKYFSDDENLINFAKLVISKGDKKAVKVLNKYIGILGKSVKPQVIIEKVRNEFDLGFSEAMLRYKKNRSLENAITVMETFGYQIKMEKPAVKSFFLPYSPYESFIVTGNDLNFNFTSTSLLEFVDKLMPRYYRGN